MMESGAGRTEEDLFEANRRFYDAMWAGARLVTAERFNTWPLVRSLLTPSPRLEVGPGLRPRLPIAGTHFLDASVPALEVLRGLQGRVALGRITALPYPDGSFDPVCALDIIEHVDDEHGAFAELTRVTAPGGALLLSVPLHPSRWTAFDDFVGHRRRYEPGRLLETLGRHGLTVERSAGYGMQPKSSRLLDFGMWWLQHRRDRAMWWYNHVIMRIGLRFQKKLAIVPGMIDMEEVDEILLVCRKNGSRARGAGEREGAAGITGRRP